MQFPFADSRLMLCALGPDTLTTGKLELSNSLLPLAHACPTMFYIPLVIIIYEKSQFDSLVWSTLAPITVLAI